MDELKKQLNEHRTKILFQSESTANLIESLRFMNRHLRELISSTPTNQLELFLRRVFDLLGDDASDGEITRTRNDETIRYEASRLLSNWTCVESGVDIFVRSGMMEKLVRLVSSTSSKPESSILDRPISGVTDLDQSPSHDSPIFDETLSILLSISGDSDFSTMISSITDRLESQSQSILSRRIRHQTYWCLGNLAADREECRTYLQEKGIVEMCIETFLEENVAPNSIPWRTFAWTLANFCYEHNRGEMASESLTKAIVAFGRILDACTNRIKNWEPTIPSDHGVSCDPFGDDAAIGLLEAIDWEQVISQEPLGDFETIGTDEIDQEAIGQESIDQLDHPFDPKSLRYAQESIWECLRGLRNLLRGVKSAGDRSVLIASIVRPGCGAYLVKTISCFRKLSDIDQRILINALGIVEECVAESDQHIELLIAYDLLPTLCDALGHATPLVAARICSLLSAIASSSEQAHRSALIDCHDLLNRLVLMSTHRSPHVRYEAAVAMGNLIRSGDESIRARLIECGYLDVIADVFKDEENVDLDLVKNILDGLNGLLHSFDRSTPNGKHYFNQAIDLQTQLQVIDLCGRGILKFTD